MASWSGEIREAETTNVDETDQDGNTPLHLAVLNDHTDATVELLKHHRDLIPRRNNAGFTALHLCAKSDLDSATSHASLIIKSNPSALETRDRKGSRTAQELAETSGHRKMAKYLDRKGKESKEPGG